MKTWLGVAAGLAASVVVSATAQAAVFTYTFTGQVGGIVLGATEASDKAFTLTLVGDTAIMHPEGDGSGPLLTSAKLAIDGVTDGITFGDDLHFGFVGRVLFFGGGDRSWIDFELSDDVAKGFDFTGPLGPVEHEELAFNFNGVGTSGGNLTLVRPTDVRFTVSAPVGNPTAVPEQATWALMIGGFGLAGAALRRRGLGVA